MENETLIPGLVLLLLGWFYAMRPDLMVRLQVWSQRVIMGAKYEPSPRTFKVIRGLGIAFVVLGLFIITGIIK